MKKQIKVCFVSLGSYPLFNPSCEATFGGAEVQMYFLAKKLAEDPNFSVSFIVGDFGQESMEIRDGVNIYKCPQLKNRKIRLFPYGKIWFAYLLVKIKADIYIQRSASLGTGFVRLMSYILGKKFIYMSAHEIDCNGDFERRNPWFVGKFFQYGIRNADLVITQNNEHYEMIKRHHKKESIIINSVYELPNEKDELPNKNFILWVGRVEDWKQPEVFIELAENFHEENFVMIAPRSNNQSEYFKEIRIKASKVSNLKYIDFVPFKQIDEYFKKSKIYILTSKNEGFPNTFVQAAKNKTPILSLSVNPNDFINENLCGFCANGNKLKLREDLNLLLSDENSQKRLGENAYMYAKREHDINKIIENYKLIFRNLS